MILANNVSPRSSWPARLGLLLFGCVALGLSARMIHADAEPPASTETGTAGSDAAVDEPRDSSAGVQLDAKPSRPVESAEPAPSAQCAATTRIRVKAGESVREGSGTIVDSRPGATIVLRSSTTTSWKPSSNTSTSSRGCARSRTLAAVFTSRQSRSRRLIRESSP